MSKRKPMDKTQARERRNRLLETAAAAELSLTEGVREMRAIAGMTQDEFARHRGVSARVIKAIELGQGNPTVATLNRIGEFFGLEVAFVPIRRDLPAASEPDRGLIAEKSSAPVYVVDPTVRFAWQDYVNRQLTGTMEDVAEAFSIELKNALGKEIWRKVAENLRIPSGTTDKPVEAPAPEQPPAASTPVRKKKKPDAF